MDAWFPKERIGFFEGQASSFYNVSPIERDYFEMWYFANLGAYKASAHGAPAGQGRPRSSGGGREIYRRRGRGTCAPRREAAARPAPAVDGRRVHGAQPDAQLMRARAILLCWIVALPAPASPASTATPARGAQLGAVQARRHRQDRGRPRARRAPDCAVSRSSKPSSADTQHYSAKRTAGRRPGEAAMESCRACHSPRYATEQNAAAQRGLAIGEMKQREAEALVEVARKEISGGTGAHRETARHAARRNLRDLRLGLAHQSPDYQWWLGQAALDGSLLRIKGALGEARSAAQ
jgi:hypothetical protein